MAADCRETGADWLMAADCREAAANGKENVQNCTQVFADFVVEFYQGPSGGM